MGPEVVNRNKDCEFNGDYVGRDKHVTNIMLFQDSEREFVVTHNANIKPVAYFTGRETELKELRQRIEEGRKSVLVSGMGGIGKTHICRKLFEEYLNKHAEDGNGPFRHIGYIEYSGDMDGSLQNGLKFKQQDSPENNREAAWRELEYLASDGKLLLFVDNVDKTLGADPGLQRLRGIPGAVVLTSRWASFSDDFEPYRIGFLDMEQCKEIYEKIRYEGSRCKIGSDEVEDLEYIIENLAGRHTITVELLAHLARTKPWTVKKLREELGQKGFRLAFHKSGEFVNIQESYEKLYDLSELTEAEQNILEAFSVFPYIPLAAETCNQWLLADAGVSEDDDILMGLYQKGWLQFDWEQESYAMHPVFAQFIYNKHRPNAEKHAALIKACGDCIEIPADNFLLECQTYLSYVKSVIEKIDMDKDMEWVGFINKLAKLLGCSGAYKEAEKYFKESLEICKELLEEDNYVTAGIYHELAVLYMIQNEDGKAEELNEKSLMIRKRVLGENHNDTADSYCNMAIIYEHRKEYIKAKELYEKSLMIYEKAYEDNESQIATIYNNLAGLYRGQLNYRKAEELHKKSLRIRKRVFGENNLYTAISYRNLAGVYLNTCRYREAEKLYEKSLRICQSMLGENHPDTALNYNDLGATYFVTQRYKKAETYYLKSYRIVLDKLECNHPVRKLFYNNLKEVYFKRRIVIFNRDAKFKGEMKR